MDGNVTAWPSPRSENLEEGDLDIHDGKSLICGNDYLKYVG